MPDGSNGPAPLELGLTPQDLGVQPRVESQGSGLEAYKTVPFNIDSFQMRMTELGINGPEDLVNKSSATENLLGSGGNASVFSIPGVLGYCLRVPNGRFGADTSIEPLKPIEDRFPDINLGQAVASLGGSLLLKEQTGIPAGVPYGEMRRSGGESANLAYQQSLELAALMPQSAYDSLAKLFVFLNQHGLNFDPSKSNNVLIDTAGQRFNVVDLSDAVDGQQPNNHVGYMVIPLMDNAYAWRVKDADMEMKLIEFRKTILLKCLEAAKKVGLPFPREDSSLEYSFKLAGMEDQWLGYRTQLESGK